MESILRNVVLPESRVRNTLKELARILRMIHGIPPVCQNYKAQAGCRFGETCCVSQDVEPPTTKSILRKGRESSRFNLRLRYTPGAIRSIKILETQSLRCSSHPATLLRAETLLSFKRLGNTEVTPSNFAREPATCPSKVETPSQTYLTNGVGGRESMEVTSRGTSAQASA